MTAKRQSADLLVGWCFIGFGAMIVLIAVVALFNSRNGPNVPLPELPKVIPQEIKTQLDLVTTRNDIDSLGIIVPGSTMEKNVPLGAILSIRGLCSVSNITVTVDGIPGVGTSSNDSWGAIERDPNGRNELGESVPCRIDMAQFPSLASKCGSFIQVAVSGDVKYPKKASDKTYTNEMKHLSNSVRLFVVSQSDFETIERYVDIKNTPHKVEINSFMSNCCGSSSILFMVIGYLLIRSGRSGS